MPTTYTHDYFGKRVYRLLPNDMKQDIRAHGDLYRIGLHGPDVLFYFMLSKNPVSQYGVWMHNQDAASFFEENIARIRETGDMELLAYVLGFACHYLLDSASHPFVHKMSREKVISHTLLEKEFDRYLMEASGKNALVYRPSDAVVPRREYARVIHRAIPEVNTRIIYHTLKHMKIITNAMACRDGGRKRKILYQIARIAGEKNAKKLIDYLMSPVPVPEAEIPVKELNRIFENTVPEAAKELEKLYRMAVSETPEKPLTKRWHKNYQGETFP